MYIVSDMIYQRVQMAIYKYLQAGVCCCDGPQKLSRDQPGGFPLHHIVFKKVFRNDFIDLPFTDIDDALMVFNSSNSFAIHCVQPKRLHECCESQVVENDSDVLDRSIFQRHEGVPISSRHHCLSSRTTVSLWDTQSSENHFKARILHYIQTQ